jgi:hypothetical protein
MTTRHTHVTALGAAALALVLVVPVHGTSTDRHTSSLTFSAAVALPHVTLPAGTYVFERVFAGAPSVVVVRSRDGRRVHFMATTQPRVRPLTLAADQVVTFGEADRNQPPPITAWYPRDADLGYGFVY